VIDIKRHGSIYSPVSLDVVATKILAEKETWVSLHKAVERTFNQTYYEGYIGKDNICRAKQNGEGTFLSSTSRMCVDLS